MKLDLGSANLPAAPVAGCVPAARRQRGEAASESALPCLTVADMKMAIDYYTNILGFEIRGESRLAPGVQLEREGRRLCLATGGAGSAKPHWLCMVSDIEPLVARVRIHNPELAGAITATEGRRECLVRDLDGHVLQLVEMDADEAAGAER
jgi:catechol 2,3-dioxygenase-like lactoylglutathione lyase family enzyme